MTVYSTYRKTLEPSTVGIESQKNFFCTSEPRMEKLQSYASLKREVRRYKRAFLASLMLLLMCFALLSFAYSHLVNMRDTFIMHNYTYHYEGRHTTAPPLTWKTWSNVKKGE